MKYVSVLILSIASISAHAQNVGDVFGGLTYTHISVKDESASNLGTFKPHTLGLGLAYVVADHWALEVNAFDGVDDSSITKSAVNVTVKAKNGYGFAVRPFFAWNEYWGAYVKLGRLYGTQDTTTQIGVRAASTQSSSYSRTAYGLGISYNIAPKWGLTSEYVKSNKSQNETTSNTSISMGVRYKF